MKLVRFVVLSVVLFTAAKSWAYPQTTAGAVHAVVTAATGELRIYGPRWSTGVLVSVKIDDHIYTNNAASPALRFAPALMGQLRDTIEIRWATPDSIDVNFRCYPYGEDLKIEISLANRSASPHVCAAEALQSYFVQGVTAPYLGTDRDYSNIAREIPGVSSSGAPQLYYLGTIDATAPDYNPGIVTSARFTGKGLDLLGPSHLYFGIWSALAVASFGPPNDLNVGCDGGLLLVWNPVNVGSGDTAAIARWVLGQPMSLCISSDVLLMSLVTPVAPFPSNKINLAAVAYSVNQRGLTNPRLILHADEPLTIMDGHIGTSNDDTAALSGDIAKGTARMMDWRLVSLASASTPVSWALQSLGDNLQPLYRDGCGFSETLPTGFASSVVGNPVIVRETSNSTGSAPQCTSTRYEISVKDTSSGIAHYEMTGINFTISSAAFMEGTDSVMFVLSVIDWSRDGNATVTFYDRAGHSINRSYTYCSVEDTDPPVVRVESAADTGRFIILERRSSDRGIQSWRVSSSTNATVDSSALYSSIDSVTFVVRKIDASQDAAICITATDKANNTSSAVCWNSTQRAVNSDVTDNAVTLTFDSQHRSLAASRGVTRIEVYYILGQLVLSTSERSIDLSGLPFGTYIARGLNARIPVVKRISIH